MKNSFVGTRLRAFIYAFRGAYLLFKTEASIQAQAFIALLTIIAGWYFDINAMEWMFQILAIGMILAAEGMNTAIEKLCDFVHPDYHERIGFIKDVAAGAVFFVALAAVAIGLFIYIPKILSLF